MYLDSMIYSEYIYLSIYLSIYIFIYIYILSELIYMDIIQHSGCIFNH